MEFRLKFLVPLEFLRVELWVKTNAELQRYPKIARDGQRLVINIVEVLWDVILCTTH